MQLFFRHLYLLVIFLLIGIAPGNGSATGQNRIYLPSVPSTGTTSALITQDGGSITSPDGLISVTFPPHAVHTPTTVFFTVQSSSFDPAELYKPSIAFDLEAVNAHGEIVRQFDQDLTVQIQLPTDARRDVALYYYDVAQHAWIPLPSTVNTQGVLTATTTHFTTFGVLSSIYTPTISSVSPDPGQFIPGQNLNVTITGGSSGPGTLLVYIRNGLVGSYSSGPYIASQCFQYTTPQSHPFTATLIVPFPNASFPYRVGAYFRPNDYGTTCPNFNTSFMNEAYTERDYTIAVLTTPNAPTLIEPANNAVIRTPSPTLRWAPVHGATGYAVFWGANASQRTTTSGTSLMLPVSFSPYQTISWYVRATNAAGQGPSSPTYTFRYIPHISVHGRALAANDRPLINARVNLLKGSQIIGTTVTSDNGAFDFPAQETALDAQWYVHVLFEDERQTFRISDLRMVDAGGATVALQRSLSIGHNDVTVKAGEPDVDPVNTKTRASLASIANMYTYIMNEQRWIAATFAPAVTPNPSEFLVYDLSDINNATYRRPNFRFGHAYTDDQLVGGVSVVEDTVYHEMAHRVHDQIIGQPSLLDGDEDHGGADNASSAWGYIEGFANWMSAAQRNTPGIVYADPAVYVDLEINYRWNGTASPLANDVMAEEFAIAGILWDLIDPIDASDSDFVHVGLPQVWNALTQASKSNGMVAIYAALRDAQIGQAQSTGNQQPTDLDAIFIAHGFFRDTNGDGIYDTGEQVGPSWDPAHSHRINKGPSPAIYGVRVITAGGNPDAYLIRVDVRDNPSLSYEYRMPATDAPDGLVRLYPPDTQYDVEISIHAQTANGQTNPLLVEGQGFWGAVGEHAGDPELAQVTLTVGSTTPIQFDQTPPVTTAQLHCALPGTNEWCRTDIGIKLSATDDRSGVAYREYQLDEGDWNILPGATSTITLTVEGIHTLRYRAVDKSKNVEQAQEVSFKLDKTPPEVQVWTDQALYTRVEPFIPRCSTSDAISGIAEVVATVDGMSTTCATTVDIFWFALGTHVEVVQATDHAGWTTTCFVSFEVIATLDSLRASVLHLHQLHEINNDGVTNSLLAKIDGAIAANERGQSQVAINMLNALINQVESQSGKHISTRAADLLINDMHCIQRYLP